MEAEHKNARKHGRQLKSRPTIALLTHSISDAYGSLLWTGAMDAAREADANLICLPGWALNDERGFNAQANIIYELISTDRVDGLVFSSGTLVNYIGLENFLTFCKRYALPMASIAVELEGIPSVLIENYERMLELMDHLIEVHKISRFAYISGPTGNNDEERDRYKGFVDSLEKHHLSQNPNLISPPAQWEENSGMAAIRLFLDERRQIPVEDFQAVVTGSDNLASGALVELQSRNIAVPEGVVLTGFDAQERSGYLTPSLTTVWQPIYEQARQATKLVLAQLRHESVPDKVMLPTKLVVRQSCGCPEPAVVKAKVGLIAKAVTRIKTALAVSRRRILAEKITDLSGSISSEQAGRLVGVFYRELKGESSGSFLSTLDDTLRQVALARSDVSVWGDVISLMRREILPHISDDQVSLHVEDLFQQARVMIGERVRRAQGYSRLEAEQRAGRLSEINQALVTSSDAQELMGILANGLPQLGIPACYLSLYENPVVPTKRCQLILAYNDKKGRMELEPDRQSFPSSQLVPDDILAQDRSYRLVVEPLYFRENQLGIAVFEVGPQDGVVYETLRGQLSSALWGAHLVQLLRSLYEASNSLQSLQKPQAILDDVVEKVCQVVRAQSAQIILIDKNGEPRGLASGGNPNKSIRTTSILIGIKVIPIKAMQKNQPILISDTRNETDPEIQKLVENGIGAAGCFPLQLRGKSIGVMWMCYEQPHHFPAAEVNALELYLNQTAIAYDNAKRMKELEHLQQASEKIASAADVREVLKQIVESAHDVLEADSVAIWSYDASRQTFLPDELVTHRIPEELVENSKLHKPRHRGTAAAVIRQGYLAVTDVDHAKYKYLGRQAHGLRGEIGVKSFQGIVLKVGDEVLGVLYVNYQVSREFDDEEESTLKVFAHHAALALKKARLLKRVRMVSETARVVAEVSAQEDLHSTLKAIVEGTLDAFGCDAVTLNVYNPITSELGYPPAMAGVNHPERVQHSKRGETSIVHEMLQMTEPCIVEEVARNYDFKDRRFVKDEEIKSCIAIPLDAANEKVGVMFVNYRTQHHFTGQEIEDIKLFAYQAAVAIRNAQLYDDTTRKAQYLEALYEAGKTVTSTLTLDEILKSIVEQVSLLMAQKGLRAHFCYLALNQNGKLSFKAAYPPSSYQSKLTDAIDMIDLEHTRPIGIIGRAVKEGKSWLVADVSKYSDYIVVNPETHSELAVPIKLREDVIGVIAVEHSDLGAFDWEDAYALEALADQAAIAIRNARDVEEIEHRALQMQTASDVARHAASILNIEQLLHQVVNLISHHFHFYHTAIFFLEKEYALLKAASSEGGQKMLDEMHKLKVGEVGIVGYVAKTGEPRIALDVDKDVDFFRNRHLPDTRSEMVLPLQIHGQLIGVLDVQSSEPNAFSTEDITALQTMADQLAIAIHNAQQYEELKQTKGLVGSRTALAWMGMASSDWRHSIDMHARTIVEQVALLRRELTKMLQTDNYSQVDGRLTMVQKLARQIQDKPITPPLSSEEGVVSVEVNALIQERTDRLWESEPHKSVELKLGLTSNNGLTVRVSPEWLRRALDILINNAIAAMIDSLERHITIETCQKGNQFEILIRDSGKGISDEVKLHLFIDPIKKVKGDKGLGVGLLMAQVIVQTYGGEIGVDSTGPAGTTTFVRLPLEP